MAKATNPLVYIGTYTQVLPHVNGHAEGIYICELDRSTGAISTIGTGIGVANPSFVTFDVRKQFLYAVEEVGEYQGQVGGGVAAFAIENGGRTLTRLNSQPTHGAHSCHLSIDPSGRWLLVANYSGGNLTVLPIEQAGTLGAPSQVVQHAGSAPHAHMIRTAPGGWVLAADLGLNQLLIYQLDQAKGQLTHAPSVGATLPAGAGPRHFDFHPNGRLVYCINELGSTLTTFSYDAGQGQLTELQTISTLPADFTANNSCADIHVHPNGKFLYGSNRGHDSIALFSIEKGSGIPTLIGHTPSGGRTPRNFAIDPTGTLMLVANQDSDNVVSFMIDPATGALTPTGQEVTISAPVCVCFA